MVTANIIINQTGKPAGLPGESRDDLSLGTPVELSNDENSGVTTWTWTLLAKPGSSSAGLDTPSAATCRFTPDVAGSYLVQLVLNGRVRATAIAAVRTSYLGLRIPATGETTELGGWETAVQQVIGELEDGIQAGGGGGGTLDRCLVFSDDTQFAEAGGSFVTKKTFRIVRDANKAPTSWRIVVSMWCSGPSDTAECCVVATGGSGSESLILPGVDGNAETVIGGNLAISDIVEPVDQPVTIEIQLRLAAGTGTAYLQYTDVFAVYTAGPA